MRAALGLCCVVVLLVPVTAEAFCGFYVAGADQELYNNATVVVLMREGTRTVQSMANNYEGPPQDFAMVVPVPVVLQEENVRTLSEDIFDRVDRLAAPRLVEYWEQDPCMQMELEESADMAAPPTATARAERAGSGAEPMVTIEAQFEVGEYDIVILSAREATALDAWLRQNGYNIPDGAADVLRPYVEGGMKFFVAKVNIERVRMENGMAMLSPLRFHYDSDDFNLPVRLGLLNSKGTQDLLVHILAPNQRYELANYPNVTIPTNLDVADAARDQFGAFYAALFDRTLEQNPKAIVTEYAWQATNCDPCPGPVLSASDITTLGADVLPSTSSGMQANVQVQPATVQGDIDRTVAMAVVQSKQAQLQACLQQAGARGRASAGSTNAVITVGANGLVSGDARLQPAYGDEPFKTCVSSALSSLRFPPPASGQTATVTVPLILSLTPSNPWEVMNRMNSFVLTRLHARYSAETLENDLVFRPADPIVGGREMMGGDGALEKGSQPSSVNNFQGRYAIRHPWAGPIACNNPRRGIWGGPPPGVQGSTTPKAAEDIAFAPRGGVNLRDMLKSDVPELELTGVAATQPSGTGVGATGTGGGAGAGPGRTGGACDCGVAGAGTGAPLAALALISLLGLTLAFRRR